MIESTSTIGPLQADLIDPPNLTNTLQQDSKRFAGAGSFGIVYRCLCARNGEVAVKAITFFRSFDQIEKDEFLRKMRRELGIWRRLHHPNIVPLLGTARGEDFGSDHPCMVSMWMPHGTLGEYVRQRDNELSLPSRIRLITGSAAGLEYLHSKSVVHRDFHPGNILIDSDHNPRLTDFGLSQTVSPDGDQLSYLWTSSTRAGAVLWTAPELLYLKLYTDIKIEATLKSDIYSLGSITLFILSGKFPWKNGAEAENKLKEFQNPSRPVWPVNIPDSVWNFIEQCWSPRQPRNRPSAQEVLVFSRDKLERLFQPNPASDINVVLFGAVGCGKSSIVNLLSEESVAHVSADVEPCTKRPRWYQISIGDRRVRLWDTTGFRPAHGGDTSHLLPYEQAHAVLRNLPDGVNLILLCARKDGISPSLGRLYWLINDFFYGGRAPIVFVVTHFDTPDEQWWERNQDTITERTGIPVQSIPHARVTMVQTDRDQSKQALEALLRTYAAAIAPISARLDLSSHTTTSLDLTTRFRLSSPEVTALVETFGKPLRPFNVVLFGQTGAGMSSVINLLVGHPVTEVSIGLKTCTQESRSYRINTGMQQFIIWDTVGISERCLGRDVRERALANAAQLIRYLSGQGGVDLLVYCRYGRFTELEQNIYTLFEEFLCEGKVPVAVVVTHLEWQNPMEEWWEMNGEGLVKAIGGDVIGHACITSLASDHASAIGLRKQLLVSRLSVQAMLEDCISTSAKRTPKRPAEMGGTLKKMTVTNLMNRGRLTKTQAEELIRLRYGSG